MRRLLVAMILLGAAGSAHGADRDGQPLRERDAAWQMVERQFVAERYRYYVPVSAFTEQRGSEPRAAAKWRPAPSVPVRESMW